MRDPFSDKWHLPFVRKFRWKISVTWYWYFLEPKTGTGLNCAIYKIPVNFSLSLDLTPGTGNPNKWYRKFRSFRWQREKGNTSKGITFFPEKVHQGEPFPLNSPRNFQVFHTNGKRSRFHKHNRRPHVMNMYLRHYWLHNGFASFGWKACLSSRAPKHRFVWDYFPLKKYCCKEPQKCISAFFYICCQCYLYCTFFYCFKRLFSHYTFWETSHLPLP